MAKCNINNCTLDSVKNDDKCILHCVKSNYSEDSQKNNFLKSFNYALIDYILDKFYEYKNKDEFPTRDQLTKFLKGTDKADIDLDITPFLWDLEITISRIIFPEHDSRDLFDYEKVLEKIGGVCFDLCEFYVSNLNVKNPTLFFQQCIFHKKWNLHNYKVLENVRNVLYENCDFKEDISTVFEINEKPELDNPVFSDCYFAKSLILEDVKINNRLFKDTGNKTLTIIKIRLDKCTFIDKFILNRYKIDKFICTDTFFYEKIEFKNNNVNSFEINNTNFSKLVDCYHTSYKKFKIVKSIFDDFVNFENCEFGLVDDPQNKAYLAEFLYATMMSFINFRHAIFNSGLDLAHINLKEPPNFFNAVISPYITNRETFRIIKYSFDRVGNYIEANKYYEMEMSKFKDELYLKRRFSTYLLLRIYGLSSNYGQSYFRPIILILIASLVYWLLIIGYQNDILYTIYPGLNGTIRYITNILNGISRHIMPISKVLKEGMEFVSLLFYISFTTLIWLIILAIKRSTKR